MDDKNAFQQFHDGMRRLCRRAFVRDLKGTYHRPRPKTHKGKKAARAAKRANVAAMKAAGHFRGDNRPFEQL